MTPAAILRSVRTREFWLDLAPHLHIDRALHVANQPLARIAAALDLSPRGYTRIESAVSRAICDALAGALRSLHDARIPTPFVFAFDEAWDLARNIAPTFGALIPDLWAWYVPSHAGARGWSPHRGASEDVRDETGAPTLVNVWVALSDVTKESACIQLVPLDLDPHYPHALDRIDVPRERFVALPVHAGGVLAWNANVLHEGGVMQAGAPPRVSLSFSCRRSAALAFDSTKLTLDGRIDLMADMIRTYADADAIDATWREWADLDFGMRAFRR